MNTSIKHSFLLPALIAGFGLILAGGASAQTLTTLHSFSGPDGALPQAEWILSGDTLYGTANGSSWGGTVFAVKTNGTGFIVLHSFTATSGSPPTNSDGRLPVAGLVLSGDTLYGTAGQGGSGGVGTVFAVKTNGSGFTNLHSFTALKTNSSGIYTNRDGAYAFGRLVLSGDTLYGTAQGGGNSGNGTIFAVNTDGTRFTNLHSFTAAVNSTNSDGINPYGGLLLAGNILYGTAQNGGGSGNGTVFGINTDGTGFTNLHSFTATSGPYPPTNSDGARPFAGLLLSCNTLYGAAYVGGSSGNGTVFAVSTNGTGFTTLHHFTALLGSANTNRDGSHPWGGVVLSGRTLYGTTVYGGSSGNGAVFAVNTNGTGFTNMHSFTATGGVPVPNSDGASPQAGLLYAGNMLYGAAQYGGSYGWGTVFSLSLPTPPTMGFAASGNGLTLSWPSNGGFTLQSAPSVTGAYTNVPGATSPYTNGMTGSQRYFRLQGN